MSLGNTSVLYRRLDFPPPRIRARTPASASPGLKIGDVSHATYTRGSSTRSVMVARRSLAMGGVVAEIGGTGGPAGIAPKYFSTRALIVFGSKSPAMARLALP